MQLNYENIITFFVTTNVHHFYVFVSPATRVSENIVACCNFARVVSIALFANFLQRTLSFTTDIFVEFARTTGKINNCLVKAIL